MVRLRVVNFFIMNLPGLANPALVSAQLLCKTAQTKRRWIWGIRLGLFRLGIFNHFNRSSLFHGGGSTSPSNHWCYDASRIANPRRSFTVSQGSRIGRLPFPIWFSTFHASFQKANTSTKLAIFKPARFGSFAINSRWTPPHPATAGRCLDLYRNSS